MLYGFRHYPTPNGRRVECRVAADDYQRALARVVPGYFDGVAMTPEGDTVRLTMTVGAAIRLADAMAGVGGEASVVARMLGDHLDEMAGELNLSSYAGAPATAARRQFRKAVGF